MSEVSVSTTSSRIKQFGLYRTIDARTEEFLRLSRKRQLRQGCACAAVSTAITVTIVVTVILIYEYGIISEFSSKTTLKSNWLGLMNTSEGIPFEAKLNKASINLESSIRLLPLILKALKKNRYYDNIIEDDTSPSPLYEKKETDNLLTKNIFSDSRNWMRIPTSRIYAIEYKTSPIVYYNNPTRNTEYFTKIRRIRDYKRIMNYVDKMISEKVTGSTVPMLKSSYAFDKNLPIPYTTPMSRRTYKTKHKFPTNPKKSIGTKKPKCSCPKKMNDLLNKMITLLQKLLPNATQDILKMPKPCDHSKKKKINDVTESSKTTVKDHIKSGINLKTVQISSSSESKNTTEVTLPPVMKGKLKQAVYLLKSLPPKVDYTLQTIIRLIRPKKFRGYDMVNDLNLQKSKTKKQSSESSEDYYFSPEDTTQSFTMLKTSSIVPSEPDTANLTNMVVDEEFLNTNDSHITSNILTTLPTFNEKTADDYLVVNTTPNIVNNFNSLDVHSMELVKSKILPNEIKSNDEVESLENNDQSKLLLHNNTNIFQNNSLIWGLLAKMGQLIKSKSIKSETNNEDPINKVTDHDVITNSSYKTTSYLQSVDSTPHYTQTIQYLTTTPLNPRRESNLNKNDYNKNESDLTFKSEDETLEDEEEKMFYEEALTSNNIKNLEKIINLFNNSETEQNNTNIKTPLYQWENINIADEETTKYNIPKSRSSYLEIQRNDWKHDEHEDYENNIINSY